MLLSIVVVTNYPLLGDVSPMMIFTLLGSVLLIGIGEELMFRGITLETLRKIGRTTELKTALWATLIFGGAHASNVFTEGPGAFLQAVVASASGLLFYVVLRVSGTMLVPIILHAGWDFSLFSGNLRIDPKPYIFAPVSLLTILVLTIIVLVRWRAIWPPVTHDAKGTE
jgi:membrane protease YdiL (CAAX protease family)